MLWNASFTVHEVRAGDGEHDREGDEEPEANDRFGAELTKCQPDHERTSSFGRRSCSTRAGHVGKDEVFEVEALDRPRRIEDGLVGPHDERALAVGVALADDLLIARQGVAVAARSGQPVVGCEQLVDVAGDLDARVDEHD